MKIIESYFHILNQIKLITNDKIESEAETSLIFSSRLFQEYFGQRLEKEEIFGKFSDYDLEENMLTILKNIISKRSNGIPIQYILDEAWFYKKEISNNISNTKIDDIYNQAKSYGALGGKLLGAGGGGFMLFYAKKDQHDRIKNSLKEFIFVPMKFEFSGSKVVYFSHSNE